MSALPGEIFGSAVRTRTYNPSVNIKSITWKGKNLLRELLEVGVETKIEGVEIVLSPLVANLNIRVRNARGEPMRDVSLTLVPSDPARWTRQETSFSEQPT